MSDDRLEKMRQVKDEVVNLTESPLYKYRKENNYYPVIGEGNHYAKIVFVGEAPGKNEAETARPFCGAAGRILDELLESIDTPRENVYITNIVKDRPPKNRDPTPDEIMLYAPFLTQQLEIIQPDVVATLGRFSMEFIMKLFGLEKELQPISRMHGKEFMAEASWGNIHIVPLYHPAVALYNGSQRPLLEEDFQVLKKYK